MSWATGTRAVPVFGSLSLLLVRSVGGLIVDCDIDGDGLTPAF